MFRICEQSHITKHTGNEKLTQRQLACAGARERLQITTTHLKRRGKGASTKYNHKITVTNKTVNLKQSSKGTQRGKKKHQGSVYKLQL